MRILCRFGRHSPVRTQSLIDAYDLKRRTHCKRCGVPMIREPQTGWQVEAVGDACESADGEDKSAPAHPFAKAMRLST